MADFVVDASSMVEYLLETSIGMRVAEIIEDAQLIAPEIMDAEVMSTLRGAVLNGRLEPSRAEAVIASLSQAPIERVSHQGLSLLAWRYYQNVSAYDAFYLAVAHINDIPLITCDGRLARASGLNVEVRYIPLPSSN